GGGRGPTCPAWFNIEHQEGPPAPPAPKLTTTGAAPEASASRGFFSRMLDSSEQGESRQAVASAAPAPVAHRNLGLAASFGEYARTVGNAVHSGSGRTALADNNTDYYPVSLSQQTLRPGPVYAEP